jgi:CheY-like chemotaxis protein
MCRAGHVASVAGDRSAALAWLETEQSDAILCDVRMPITDGHAFRERLAARRPDLAGKAGELIWGVITNAEGGQSALLMADTNGDKLVDMSIEFVGITSFSNADFIF